MLKAELQEQMAQAYRDSEKLSWLRSELRRQLKELEEKEDAIQHSGSSSDPDSGDGRL